MAIPKIRAPAGIRFVADLYQAGADGKLERIRQRLTTRGAAGADRRDLRRTSVPTVTAAQQLDAAAALAILAGGTTLTKAAHAWADAQAARPAPAATSAAFAEFVGSRQKRLARERYLATLAQSLRAAARAGGENRPLASALAQPAVRAWIMSDDVAAVTRATGCAMSACSSAGRCAGGTSTASPTSGDDPLSDLERPRRAEDTRPVSILTPAAAKIVVGAARSTPVFAHFCLGLFASLRPMEA